MTTEHLLGLGRERSRTARRRTVAIWAIRIGALAAVLAHETVFDALQPYAELYFMDDRTHQQVAPSALFKDSNPLDPFGTSEYPVNCDNPLLSAQEASLLCSPAQLAFVTANPGQACIFNTDPVTHLVSSPNCADVRIGRRNIVGIGIAHFFSRRFDDAIPILRPVIQEFPRWATPYCALASCFAHVDFLSESEAIARRLKATDASLVPNAVQFRDAKHRELLAPGLKLAGAVGAVA